MLFPYSNRVIFLILLLIFLLSFLNFYGNYSKKYYSTSFVDFLKQPDDITCGPTCAAMLLRFYGKDVTVDEIKLKTKTVWFTYKNQDFGMTAPEMIKNSLQEYGLNSFLKTGDLRKIKYYISQNKPCIVLVRSSEYNWHYVVVTGYDGDFIYFANPATGETQGLSQQEFLASWDWSGDLMGRKCSWWIAFWLRSLEIYPCCYVFVD